MLSTLERLRAHAQAAYGVAVEAVHPRKLLVAALSRRRGAVSVAGTSLPRVPGRRVLLALGKAGPSLADAWMRELPGWATEAMVLAPHGVQVTPLVAESATLLRGAHPVPDSSGVEAARSALALARGLDERDLLVVLLSGGSSALLAAPEEGVELDQLRAVTAALLKAGAPIAAVNTVRRELLVAAGGGLARSAFPAQVVTLVLSDVFGDPLADIASGPTVPSPTGPADALAVLDRYRLRGRQVAGVRRFLDVTTRRAPLKQHWINRSTVAVLANNTTAVNTAAVELQRNGFAVVRGERPLQGEAAARGRQLAALARSLAPLYRFALVLGGETTVRVRGRGRGGRSQELALAAAVGLESGPDRVLLAAGTDGIDGATLHAGAVVDPTTAERLRRAGYEPAAVLASNDSGTALAAVGDAIVTGPTGTNVCDLVLLLASDY